MIKPFSKTIGLVGGGQLGKMLIESAAGWNIPFHVLDPSAQASAAPLAAHFIKGGLRDDEKIIALSKEVDVLTFEIEHISTEALRKCRDAGLEVIPSPEVLEMIQDKGFQKSFYSERGIKTTSFRLIEGDESWKEAASELKGEKLVAKSRKGGYDGKGVEIVERKRLLEGYIPFNQPSVLEEFVENAIELSVIAAVDKKGNTRAYPAVQMHFDPRSNLVDYLFSPALVSAQIEKEASELALKTVRNINQAGLYAVEMFVDAQNQVYVNEVAPRPHNSGHHTIESFYCSQYEMLVRILCDLPLGSVQQIMPSVMVNLVGPQDVKGAYQLTGVDECLSMEGVYIHVYNKQETRPDRKLGHFTCMAPTLDEAIQMSKTVQSKLQITAVK